MKLFRKIDPITGNFIEDVIFESHPTVLDAEGNTVLDAQYVEKAPKQGFYLPRWNGTEWVEGGEPSPIPEPTTPPLSTDEKLTQMAEQLIITQQEVEAAQEALDFLLLGGM